MSDQMIVTDETEMSAYTITLDLSTPSGVYSPEFDEDARQAAIVAEIDAFDWMAGIEAQASAQRTDAGTILARFLAR